MVNDRFVAYQQSFQSHLADALVKGRETARFGVTMAVVGLYHLELLIGNQLVFENLIKKPKIRQIRPHYVPSGPELERIFEHLFPGARLFFLALCNTGCRLAEIQKTNVSDADFDQRLLRVIRKGGKIDYVPLNETLLDAIRENLERRGARPDDPLFLNNHGKRYLRITRSLRTACKNAMVPHTTHHGLRHAYATLLHEAGHDTGTISKLLGHANPTITQNIYIHWKSPEIRRAAESVAVGKLQKSAKSQKVLIFEKKTER